MSDSFTCTRCRGRTKKYDDVYCTKCEREVKKEEAKLKKQDQEDFKLAAGLLRKLGLNKQAKVLENYKDE